jgi:hypothetical protein
MERAFALARTGEPATIAELRHMLRREGYEQVDFHLAGKLTQKQLLALIAAAQRPAIPPDAPATPRS